jgi:hypothetical protein
MVAVSGVAAAAGGGWLYNSTNPAAVAVMPAAAGWKTS